jgi:hypothetical protein
MLGVNGIDEEGFEKGRILGKILVLLEKGFQTY